MLVRYCLLAVFTLVIFSNVFGQQAKLQENLVADSIIQKFKIKQIIENSEDEGKANWMWGKRIEVFDTNGNILQRTKIYSSSTQCVYDFKYNIKKNEIKVREKYYEWHQKENKIDTSISTWTKKYNLKTKANKKYKSRLPTTYISDSLGRIIRTIDTVFIHQNIIDFIYDSNGRLKEKKEYMAVHGRKMFSRVIYYYYDTNGVKIKEIVHIGFKKDDWADYGAEEVTIFQYDDLGLLKEKIITKQRLSSGYSKPDTNSYKYEYKFY